MTSSWQSRWHPFAWQLAAQSTCVWVLSFWMIACHPTFALRPYLIGQRARFQPGELLDERAVFRRVDGPLELHQGRDLRGQFRVVLQVPLFEWWRVEKVDLRKSKQQRVRIPGKRTHQVYALVYSEQIRLLELHLAVVLQLRQYVLCSSHVKRVPRS